MNIQEKAKRILGISTEIDIGELFDKMYLYRASCHPDKYPNESKNIATEKFIEASNILNELKCEMKHKAEIESIGSTKQLEIYGKYFDKRQEQFEIIDLHNKLIMQQHENQNLKEKLIKYYKTEKRINRDNIEQKSKLVLEKISLKKRDAIFFGGAFSVATLLIIIQQFSVYKDFIINESFINVNILKFFTTLGMIILVMWMLMKVYIEKNYSKVMNHIDTTTFRKNIAVYCKENGLNLSESSISNYIDIILSEEKTFTFLCEKIYFIKKEYLVELFKDHFIYSSIKKRFLKYYETNNGEHLFKFVNSSGYYRDDEDFDIKILFEAE